MATASGRPTTYLKPAPAAIDSGRRSVEERLFADGASFNFFQAARILEKLHPDHAPVGFDGPADREIARFAAHVSHSFPPSQIFEIRADKSGRLPPVVSVAFFGLVGPSGVLPRHYTEALLRLQRDAKHTEKFALRDWLDLFTHRMLSLFLRAWEKYRFYIPYERGQSAEHPPDPFTHCLLSLAGLGMGSLRNRIRVLAPDGALSPFAESARGLSPSLESAEEKGTVPLARPATSHLHERTLGRVEDAAILHYAGLLARRPRTAAGLSAVLADYFQAPVEVRQFHGQWLQLEPPDQSQLGCELGHCQLGEDMVIGERIWDVEGHIRIRLGPLDYDHFIEFLPHRAPVSASKAFFLLSHLTRLFIGPTLDFDVQLLLEAESVPDCILGDKAGPGCRLGWNTWLRANESKGCVEDAVFDGQEVFRLNAAERN
jgi:type VI secretion system protein ImpH